MTVLYVTRPGAVVRKKNGRLQVWWQQELVVALPLRAVERVVLLGPIQLTAGATQALLRHRIPVLLGTTRGTVYGVLSTGGVDGERLLLQVERYRDAAYRLRQAKAVVEGKIRHQHRFLQRQNRNAPQPVFRQAAGRLRGLLGRLASADSIPEVMGIEGQASAVYFAAFEACLRQEGLRFPGRHRRPPTDPVNALLSLGYMLVLMEIIGALMAQGLHPGIGFLHEVSRHQPALALDLLELARSPIVDRLTLSLLNRGVLKADDFYQRPDGAVYLKEEGLQRYLRFYERAMSTPFPWGQPKSTGTFRDWLRHLSETLREAIVEGQPWKPTLLKL